MVAYMSKQSIRDQLVDVEASRTFVKIRRCIRKAEVIEGFVVGVGKQWALVHAASSHQFLDSHAAIRISDVCAITRSDKDSFDVRALELLNERPETLSDVDLSSDESVIRTMGENTPLITIHTERAWPDECYIGELRGITDGKVLLREINPNAKWSNENTSWRLKDVTQVERGGRYEQALQLVGGEPPQ